MSGKKKGEGYRVIRGISWPTGKADKDGRPTWHNVEAGEERTDLPKDYISDWLGCGAIEPLDASGDAAAEETR